MKIKLPNPADYLLDEDSFWEQLDLAIYHAKKSWEKVLKKHSPDDKDNYPWLSFTLEPHIEKAIDDARVEKHEYDDRQEISIEINELK